MTNGVSTHDNADISIGEKVSSLVAGDFKLVPWHLPFHFTGWRAEPFIIEAIRCLPEYCTTTDVKKLQIIAFAFCNKFILLLAHKRY